MTENIIISRFCDIQEAKTIYKILKKSINSSDYEFRISQVVLLQKENGKVKIWDQHRDILKEIDKTVIGGVAGLVIGTIINPLAGAVLGGVGAMIGSGFDLSEQNEDEGVIYEMYSRIYEGDIVVLTIVEEENELEYNALVGKKAVDIYRWNADEIKKEIEFRRGDS